MNKYGFGLIILLTGLWSQEPVILEGGIAEALPEFKELWTLPVEGEVMDIKIPQIGNYLYVVSEGNGFFRFYKISLNGELIWMKKWVNPSDPYLHKSTYGLKSSNSGNFIAVHLVGDEVGYTKIFDEYGNEILSKLADGFFYPSPRGHYLSYQATNNFPPLEIFKTNGEKVDLNDTSFLKGQRHIQRFVANDQLLVYETYEGKGFLYLITVPSGEVQWTYEFDDPFWLIDFNERNCAYTDQYIALQGTRRPADIYLFDYNGNLVWKIEGLFSNHAISFIEEGKKIIAVEKGNSVIIVNARSGGVLNKVRIKNGGLIGRPQFALYGNKLFITQAYAFGKVKKELGTGRYFSHIINLDSEPVGSVDYIIKGVLGTRYDYSGSRFQVISAIKGKHSISGGSYNVAK